MTTTPDCPPVSGAGIAAWLGGYVLLLAGALLLLRAQLAGGDWVWSWKGRVIADNLANLSPQVKLLIMGIYLSLACTFIPLNTNIVVAAVAVPLLPPHPSLADSLFMTALLVGLVGGLASTIANLNDYHLYCLLLRHRRIAAVRQTRVYRAAAAWFARRPFLLVTFFSFIPIPVDVVRMLAVTHGYRRGPFAAANFIGRFLRYAVLAGLTYASGERYGWLVVAGVLALAVAFAAVKLVGRRKRASCDSPPTEAGQENRT
ncbi:MAG: hypothetical protein NTV86_20890 [Planctomycetota bacterium]|nr:hypothetical protein [Planctomycetota bacterium]